MNKFDYKVFNKLQDASLENFDFDDCIWLYSIDCLQAKRVKETGERYNPDSKEWNEQCDFLDEILEPIGDWKGTKRYISDYFSRYLVFICKQLQDNPSQANAKRYMTWLINKINLALTPEQKKDNPNAWLLIDYLFRLNYQSTLFVLRYLDRCQLGNSDACAHIYNFASKRHYKRLKLLNREKNTPPPPNNTQLSFEWLEGDMKNLYERLIDKKYIDPKTTFERFKQAFTLDSTTSSTPPIKWKLNTTLLCYLIYQLAMNLESKFSIDNADISSAISTQFGYTKDQVKSATRWRIGNDKHLPINHKQIDVLLDCSEYPL